MPAQTLSLSQQQRLQMVLAPQLRQSLEMLQVPIMELRTMIQQEMEQNPTIEDVTTEDISVDADQPTSAESKADEKELDFDKEFEMLAQLDSEWRDYFFQGLQNSSYSPEDQEKRQFLMDSVQQTESLQEHLLDQLSMADLEKSDHQIGEMIIGSINEDGYLTSDLLELAAATGSDPEHLQDLLDVIQEMHPTGVGARSLQECLLLQLDRLGQGDGLAAQIVRDHIEKLGAHKYPQIARSLKTTPDEVQEAARLISALDPKPGRLYANDTANYVLPEVIVSKVDGEYIVIVDDDQLPHVRISNHYRRLMRDPSTADEVKLYIRDRIRSGAFLIKSIHQRQKTIHRIASEIVSAQHDFLEEGISRLHPMTMAEVADRVGVHETTVSRTVANKYMKTPSGIFEMKYFFTPGIRMADGASMSNKTVKDIISNMVSNEDPTKPFSDQAILEKLKEQGIRIARRTVAKYRLMLRIQPSHMRKRY